MTRVERDIIDTINEECHNAKTAYLPERVFMSCIKRHTKHSPETVINVMVENKLAYYSSSGLSICLSKGLRNDFKVTESKNRNEIMKYYDYHADWICDTLTEIFAYQDSEAIADFLNNCYADPKEVHETGTCYKELLGTVNANDIELVHIRVLLYKLYNMCYKMGSKYKAHPEAYREAAVSDATGKKYEYYVSFEMTSYKYSYEAQCYVSVLSLPHVRYFKTLEKAEEFAQQLERNSFRSNNQYDGKDYMEWNYSSPVIEKATGGKSKMAMACTHLLPFELEKIEKAVK